MKKLIYLTSFYVEKGTKNCMCKKVGLINYLYTFRSVSYPSCKLLAKTLCAPNFEFYKKNQSPSPTREGRETDVSRE